MAKYLRPGVYYERVDASSSNRVLIRSDVAAFIGIAEKGPLDTPVAVESFRQFQAHFGDFIGAAYLAYSVRAFFDNGGRRCWIVRVANRDFSGNNSIGMAASAASWVVTNGSEDVWAIEAASEGHWGNRLAVSMLEESSADSAITAVAGSGHYVQVASTAGFERGTLVAIDQEDASGTLQHYRRVVSFVDEALQRLYWQHPVSGNGLVYDQALTLLDANLPARIHSVSYRINVYEEARLISSYSGLGLVPEHKSYGPVRLPAYSLNTKFDAVTEAPPVIAVRALQNSITSIPDQLQIRPLVLEPLSNGYDGLAALSHRDFIGEEFSANDSDSQRQEKSRGIAALDLVDTITMVAIPDIVIQPQPEPVFIPEPDPVADPCVSCPPVPEAKVQFSPPAAAMEMPPVFTDAQIYQVQSALIAHCEKRADRFAVLDPPLHIADDAVAGIADMRAWRNRFDTTYAALYYPWLKVIEPRANNAMTLKEQVRAIPPSGHVLGQYAAFDNDTGVHRAPANRVLAWCQDLSLHTSEGQQEIFNPLAINVIRSEGPRGLRIMGARTLSSDPDWRYINVRRLLIMIRRTLNIISEWVVFEPNNAITRNKLQVVISSYLNQLLIKGALAGETADQSFFVKCDEENNPGYQRNNGQLVAEIGVAPSKPFEFIVVRVGMQENELEINETRYIASAA